MLKFRFPRKIKQIQRSSGQAYLLVVVSIAAATVIFYFGRGYFAKGQWALLYLLIVLAAANFRGAKPAVFAAILSFLAWDYFLIPPYLTFRVSDPKDWLFLFVFLIVAIIVGSQAGRLKEREAQALSRGHEADLLNNFSARLVSDLSTDDLADFLTKEALKTAGAKSALVYLPDESGRLMPISSQGEPIKEEEVKGLANWSYSHSKAIGLPENLKRNNLPDWPISVTHKTAGSKNGRGSMYLPLETSNRHLGVLYVSGKNTAGSHSFQEVSAESKSGLYRKK